MRGIVMLADEVSDESAHRLITELLALSADDPDSDICLFINSPGGSVLAGLAVYDVMQLDPERRRHGRHRARRQHGPGAAVRRSGRQAVRPPERPGPDARGVGGNRRIGRRRRDPGRQPRRHARPNALDHRPPHRHARSTRSSTTSAAIDGSTPRRRSSTASSITSSVARRGPATAGRSRVGLAPARGECGVSSYTIPTVDRDDAAWRAGHRHLQPPARRPDRLHRHADRRRRRQRGRSPSCSTSPRRSPTTTSSSTSTRRAGRSRR